MEALWQSFTADIYNWSAATVSYLVAKAPDALTFALVSLIVDACIVVPGALFFTFCDNYGFLSQYKIIQGKRPPWQIEAAGLKSLIFGRLSFNVVNEILVFYFFYGWYNMPLFTIPPLAHMARNIGIGIIIADIYGYWYHRTVHEYPTLYKWLHKQHHDFSVTSVYACFYGGDIEGFFQTLPLWVIPSFLRFSMIEWMIMCKVIMECINIHMHAGYEFPWDVLNMWPFISASHHTFHHSHNNGAYGLIYFRFWDDVFGGTNKTWYEWLNRKKKGEKVEDIVERKD